MDSDFGPRTASSHSLPYVYDPHHYRNGPSGRTTRPSSPSARTPPGTPTRRSLAEGLLEAASSFGWRLPEVYAGVPRSETRHPLPYKDTCSPLAAAACGALVEVLP